MDNLRDCKVSNVDSPDIEGVITCLTDIKTEPGLQRSSKKPMRVNLPIATLISYSCIQVADHTYLPEGFRIHYLVRC